MIKQSLSVILIWQLFKIQLIFQLCKLFFKLLNKWLLSKSQAVSLQVQSSHSPSNLLHAWLKSSLFLLHSHIDFVF